ncbi:hypothetical protein Tco_1135861 [Tanacetum coccineum]
MVNFLLSSFFIFIADLIGLLCYSSLAGRALSGKCLDSDSEAVKRGRFQLLPGYMERYNKSIVKLYKASDLVVDTPSKYSDVRSLIEYTKDVRFHKIGTELEKASSRT